MCTYEVCQNKHQEEGKTRFLTDFQRLESFTIHVHMRCVKISDNGKVKKWGKSTKIWGNFKLKYIKLEIKFCQTFKG